MEIFQSLNTDIDLNRGIYLGGELFYFDQKLIKIVGF